jgi:hypothetical protein
LGNTGLILDEEQAFALLGGTQDRGPVFLEPGVPPGRVQMVSLLKLPVVFSNLYVVGSTCR